MTSNHAKESCVQQEMCSTIADMRSILHPPGQRKQAELLTWTPAVKGEYPGITGVVLTAGGTAVAAFMGEALLLRLVPANSGSRS